MEKLVLKINHKYKLPKGEECCGYVLVAFTSNVCCFYYFSMLNHHTSCLGPGYLKAVVCSYNCS